MAVLLFFGCCAAVLYVYLGYPLAVLLLAKMRPRPVKKGARLPSISLVIAAYNEEKCIGRTIENKLGLDYPREKMEIIVVSDGSSDGTDEVCRGYVRQGVRLVRQESRSGKTAALNRAVSCAEGEIVVFSDANSLYARTALKKLVRSFDDPEIGYVTGKMVYADEEGTMAGAGCGAYMRYENFLREKETLVGSVVGVNGGIDAIRKGLYRPMADDQLPDFVAPLRVVERGFRVVYEPEAVLEESSLKTAGDEYRMRVRVALRALWALRDTRRLLGFRRSGLFAWQLWSHKLMRYLCPLFLLGAYGGTLLLLERGVVYRVLFGLQTFCYMIAVLSALFHREFPRMVRMPGYFVLVNAAALHAFVRFLRGERIVMWEPRKG